MRIQNRPRRSTAMRWALAVLCLLLPALGGGCPDFRNDIVDAVDNVTRDLIFHAQEPEAALTSAYDSIFNSALDLFFDQFRGDTFR